MVVHIQTATLIVSNLPRTLHTYSSHGRILHDLRAWRALLMETVGAAARYYTHDDDETRLWDELLLIPDALTDAPPPSPKVVFVFEGAELVDRHYLNQLIFHFAPDVMGDRLMQTLFEVELASSRAQKQRQSPFSVTPTSEAATRVDARAVGSGGGCG
jgi:hypothetical protein